MNEPCKRNACQCDHAEPCVQGWIFYTNRVVTQRVVRGKSYESVREYDSVRPCPTCDAERAQIIDTSKSSEEVSRRLQQRSQFKVAENYDIADAGRTRTL
jgi:hypothetical protein